MTASSTPSMHVAELQHALSRDPGRPRLTWYGDDGERVELSGAVLNNWVAKTVNLLVEEFDAAPGSRILLDLPPHWRSVVWALAAWRAGATVVLPRTSGDAVEPAEGAEAISPDDPVDVVVTSRPAAWAGHDAPLVAVPLPALARRFDGDLPPGAIDAGSAVMTYGDQIGWVEEIDPQAVAVEPEGVRHADLLSWATASPALPPGSRVLLREADATRLLRRAVDALRVDGSVVATSVATGAALASDQGRLARLVDSERVDVADQDDRPAQDPTTA